MTQTFKLSPSSLSLFKECPRCFWLAQHKKWTRPTGVFPSLPSGMDNILKKHFDKFMERRELPPELRKYKECEGMKLFDDKELLKTWRSNFKGISVTDEKGNILHGAIDNILIKNGKIIILDYKTRGFPCKEDTHQHYQHQLDLYNYLLRKNGYLTEDYSFLLFYHPVQVLETGEVIFETTLKKMKISIEDAENLWKSALKLLAGPCPKKHDEDDDICSWCELLAIE